MLKLIEKNRLKQRRKTANAGNADVGGLVSQKSGYAGLLVGRVGNRAGCIY